MENKRTRNPILTLSSLLIYLVIVLYAAVFSRTPTLKTVCGFIPFASLTAGGSSAVKEILLNVAMFVPVGWLMSEIAKKKLRTPLLTGLGLSLCIETVQFFLHMGTCDVTDVIDNLLGTFFGAFAWLAVSRLHVLKLDRILAHTVPWLCIAGGLIVCYFSSVSVPVPPEKELAFGARLSDGVLTGFCFVYGEDAGRDYTLYLTDKNGDMTELPTETGLAREDIAGAFSDGNDYTRCGFTAKLPENCGGSYEIGVRLNCFLKTSSGVYLRGGKLCYTAEDAPGDLAAAVSPVSEDGELLVCEPEHSCWIYQYEGQIYWVTEKSYITERDGVTIVDYQIFTTQPEKLPEERRRYGFDNKGFSFENSSIDCGEYKVMVRDIPAEYAVTAITTGYMKNGSWRWCDTFRPLLFTGDKRTK